MRIVLVGKCSSEIRKVGNFILGRAVFDSEALPPSVEQHISELRIVLFLKSSLKISQVGNSILGRDAFDTKVDPPLVEQHSERARGNVEGRYITLINTRKNIHHGADNTKAAVTPQTVCRSS
ncbi:hypothetical protein MHYP_G00308970 [Metynnis hypsauchen]